MTGEIIKSFLVGLGFDVDDKSLSKFNKSIAQASLRVTALAGTIKAASAAIVYGISKVSEGFEQMGYEYKVIAPAINKAIILRREMLKAYSAAGVNLTKVIQASVKLNMSLTKTRYAFEAIYKSVASRFFDLLTRQSDLFRRKIYENMPQIQAALERFVHFVFKALEGLWTLGLRAWSILGRVWDFLKILHEATSGWSSVILGIVAAWNLLNLSFLATPMGMILAGLLAILALYDDFMTFKEGGKSFFNWTEAVPYIDFVTEALKELWGVLQGIATAVSNVILSLLQLKQGDWSGALSSFWSGFKSIAGFALNGGFGGAIVNSVMNNTGALAPGAVPIGAASFPGSKTSNATLNQQTVVNISGVADANAVGSAVSGQQYSVNRDAVRNLQGALKPK